MVNNRVLALDKGRIMRKTSLLDYVEKNGITGTANDLGVTPPAILKAVRKNRNIYVTKKAGKIEAVETKPFPGRAVV